MAHTKAGGVTKGNRNSQAKRLGVKMFGGEKVISGNIIIRQRGTKFHPGSGTKMGRDHTIFAVTDGAVDFHSEKDNKYVRVVAER